MTGAAQWRRMLMRVHWTKVLTSPGTFLAEWLLHGVLLTCIAIGCGALSRIHRNLDAYAPYAQSAVDAAETQLNRAASAALAWAEEIEGGQR